MNPHKIIADEFKPRTGSDVTMSGGKIRYEQSYDIATLNSNDLVTKQHLTNSTTPVSILTTILTGATLPVNIDVSSYNFNTRPTVIVSMGVTTTREKIVNDVEVFYNFNAGKTQVLSIDVNGHNNGSNVNLDDLFITIKQ